MTYKKKKMKLKFLFLLLKKMAFTKMKMVKYAFSNTRFYKKLYSNVKENYKEINKVPFEKLPLVKKCNINNSLPFDLLSRKEEKNVFKYAETTGSTGSPTPSFYTKKEFLGSYLLSKITPYSSVFNSVLSENRRAVCGLACGFTIAGPSFQQILDQLGFLTVNVDARTTIAPPDRVANLIARFRPSVIAAAETDFLAWMKIIREDHRDKYDVVVNNLKVLISTAELCSENRSKQLEKHFKIIHVDNYACVEGYFSLPCPCGEKHILPVYHTEVLTEDLTVTNEYGTGRFSFTNLLRKSTPFVRYLLDDYVTIYKSDCEYGFKKSIIPHGRYELTVQINNKRYGTRHFENIIFKNYLFGEYTVCVYDDKIGIILEDYENRTPPIDEIRLDFENEFNLKTTIDLIPYGTLRSYYEIRKSKPLLRLQDYRILSTQKVPMYL